MPVPLGPVRELFAATSADGVVPDSADRFALARSLLDALDRPEPVVAVIEDAHWADPATLDVLRLVARRVERTGVVVIVTYRDDELAANRALALLVGDLATVPEVRRLTLRRLSDSAVQSLAASTGVDPRELLRLTSGNPFLVVEALAARDGLPRRSATRRSPGSRRLRRRRAASSTPPPSSASASRRRCSPPSRRAAPRPSRMHSPAAC